MPEMAPSLPTAPPPAAMAALSRMGQPPGAGPVTMAQSNPGNMVGGILKVRQAITLLESALPEIPMNDPVHTDITKVLTTLLKAVPADQAQQGGPEMTNLIQMIRQAAEQGPKIAAMQAQAGGGNAPPAMGGAPPEMSKAA